MTRFVPDCRVLGTKSPVGGLQDCRNPDTLVGGLTPEEECLDVHVPLTHCSTRSKRTVRAPSSGRVLKRKRISVRIGTTTHVLQIIHWRTRLGITDYPRHSSCFPSLSSAFGRLRWISGRRRVHQRQLHLVSFLGQYGTKAEGVCCRCGTPSRWSCVISTKDLIKRPPSLESVVLVGQHL